MQSEDSRRDACLDRYARLLVEHSLGLREGQRLDICGDLIHRDFAHRVGEAAYAVGAGLVGYRLYDPRETAQLFPQTSRTRSAADGTRSASTPRRPMRRREEFGA